MACGTFDLSNVSNVPVVVGAGGIGGFTRLHALVVRVEYYFL